MKNDNFKIYGIILLVIAGYMILRNYFYWEWMFYYARLINWGIIIICAVIGIRILSYPGEVE